VGGELGVESLQVAVVFCLPGPDSHTVICLAGHATPVGQLQLKPQLTLSATNDPTSPTRAEQPAASSQQQGQASSNPAPGTHRSTSNPPCAMMHLINSRLHTMARSRARMAEG